MDHEFLLTLYSYLPLATTLPNIISRWIMLISHIMHICEYVFENMLMYHFEVNGISKCVSKR